MNTEKRATRRFSLQLPVAISTGSTSEPAQTETRDVSSRGVCFYSEAPLEPGTNVEFVLMLPPEITLTESMQVRCFGQVLRIDEVNAGKLAVAARIERYEFLPK